MQEKLGAVYNPYVDEMYSAVHCSEKSLESNIVAFGCARYNTDHTDYIFALAKELYLQSLGLRNGGSSALDLCRIASGSNGVYLELKLYPWDYGAASLICIEEESVNWRNQHYHYRILQEYLYNRI